MEAAIKPMAYGGIQAFVTSDLLGSGLNTALNDGERRAIRFFFRVLMVILFVCAILVASLPIHLPF